MEDAELDGTWEPSPIMPQRVINLPAAWKALAKLYRVRRDEARIWRGAWEVAGNTANRLGREIADLKRADPPQDVTAAVEAERARCIRVAMEFADGFPESRWGEGAAIRREVAQDVADYIGFTGDGRRGAGTHGTKSPAQPTPSIDIPARQWGKTAAQINWVDEANQRFHQRVEDARFPPATPPTAAHGRPTCKWWCSQSLGYPGVMEAVKREAHWIQDRIAYCSGSCWTYQIPRTVPAASPTPVADDLKDYERDRRYWRGSGCAGCGHRAEAHSSVWCKAVACQCQKFKVQRV